MKALVCHKFGPIDSHRVRTIPDPEPGPEDVVVDVAYAGINFPDSLIVQGLYQVKPQVPFVPGHECTGVVSQVGEQVPDLKPGDRVSIAIGIKGIAEKICVKWPHARKLPDNVPLDVAACLKITYGTTMHGLKDLAELRSGQTLLVLGASGGTGTAAIEIGKALGARVIACASTDEKLEFCRTVGADHTVNYNSADFRDQIKSITDNRGVDVVFDPVGDRYTEPAFRSLAVGGKHLVVGFAAGEIPHIPLNLVLLGERRIIGVNNASFVASQSDNNKQNFTQLFGWLMQGKIKPRITERYSLDSAPEALIKASDRTAKGKILIEINKSLV